MSYNPKSYRKFLATATAAAVLASVAAPAASSAATKKFSDVKENYWAANAIYSLVEKGIINGYGDGTFKPEKELIRGHAATLITKALDLPIPQELDAFSDVTSQSQFKEAAAATKNAGIFLGANGKFGGNDVLTREQVASVLVRAFDLVGTDQEVKFSDMDEIQAAHKEDVKILAQHGITTGTNAGKFDPKAPVTRAAFATFIHRILEKETSHYKLSIMHTNDTHAHLDSVAKRATAINEFRAKNKESLLIDAGDVFSGTLYFHEFRGKADLEFMNYLKYDVMTFGNHEFDLGSSPEGHQALADFVKNAKFTFVSANADFSNDELFKGIYRGGTIADKPEAGAIFSGVIKEVNGEKIGIFGLTTEETIDISSPGKVKFQNYIEQAKKTVKGFEEKGVNKIIAVTHIGYDDSPAYDNDLELAKAVDGIDVIVGGHSHTELKKPVVIDTYKDGSKKDPTVIVQAYQYSDFLGTLNVEFDENGKVVGQAGKLIKVADKAADKTAANMLSGYAEKIKELKNAETGADSVEALPNPRMSDDSAVSVRNSETALGNLITDGMLDKAKEFNKDTVIAMQNGGGIRAALDKGPITLGDVLTVLPFGNTLATMKLTGAEIIEALEHSIKNAPKEHGGFLHVSGMKFSYDSSKSVGERVVSVEVKGTDGAYAELDKAKSYVVATNAFTAKGGDNFSVFEKAYAEGRVTDLGLADWENLRDYVVKLKKVEPKIENRIVDVATK